VVVVALVYWAPDFFINPSYDPVRSSLIVLPELSGNLYYLLYIISFCIVLFTALILNQTASQFGLTVRISTLVLFVFVLFSSSLSTFTGYHIFILINLLLIFFIRLLFSIPDSNTQYFLSYNAALILGLASLIFLPLVYLFILLWIALIVHRANDLRNYIASLFGLATPYLFMFLWFYWNDHLDDFVPVFKSVLIIHPEYLLSLPVLDYIILLLIIVLTLISTLRATTTLTEKNINQRRNLMITIYFLLLIISIASLFGPFESTLLLLCIPSAMLVGHFLQNVNAIRYYHVMLITLSTLILINHYLKFLI
jgi:hypothetical protein